MPLSCDGRCEGQGRSVGCGVHTGEGNQKRGSEDSVKLSTNRAKYPSFSLKLKVKSAYVNRYVCPDQRNRSPLSVCKVLTH